MGKTSKRNKLVSLTKVKPKGKEHKQKLVGKTHELLESFPNVLVFQFQNFKTQPFQQVREHFTDSKFLLGKASVLKKALEETPHSKLSDHLAGNCGLIFTKGDPQELVNFFKDWKVETKLNPGQEASETVLVPQGKGSFKKHSHTIEPYLRKLGLPTRLDSGEVEILEDFVVCKAGQQLTPAQCRILKLLGMQYGEMKVFVKAVSSSGNYYPIN